MNTAAEVLRARTAIARLSRVADKVDAATVVVAAVREQVAALRAAGDPATRLEDAGGVADDGDGADGVRADGGRAEGGHAEGGHAEGGHAEGGVGARDEDQRRALRDAAAALDGLLTGVAPLLDPDTVAPLHDDLRWVLGLLAPLVDADEAHDLVDDLLDDLDPTLVNGPVTTRLSLAGREREHGAAAVLDDLLAAARWRALLDRLDRLVVDAPLVDRARQNAKPVLRDLVADADGVLAGVLSAWREAGPGEAGARRTEAIEAGEREVAVADAARIAHGKHARGLAQATRTVLEALDEHRGADAALRLLVDTADQAHRAGEPGFSYGRLHAAAERRRDAARDDLAAAVAAWSKPKRHKWLQD